MLSSPLQAFISRVVGKYIAIVRDERLLPEPLDEAGVVDAVSRFVELGGIIHQDHRASRVGWGCFARMAVLEPDFSQFESDLRRFYPNIPDGTHYVERGVVEGRLLAQRRSEDPHVTMLLGAGRDTEIIRDAHDRGDRVVVVDCDPEVILYLKEHASLASMRQSSRLVFETSNFADMPFLARHADRVDLVYFFYPNDYQQGLVAILNVMRCGAQLVTQQIYDDEGQFTVEANQSLGRPHEFRLIDKYANVVPPYQTPWARVYPSGNVVNVLQRDPGSTIAGRLFFELLGGSDNAVAGGIATIQMRPLSTVRQHFGIS